MSRVHRAEAVCAFFLGFLATPVESQDSSRVSRDSVAALPKVTVTATRKSRSVLETPVAVTVLSREDITRRAGIGLDEALNQVPGVVAQSRYGTSDIRLVIRGFGARGAGDRSNAGTSRGVRVLLDGIPETEPDGRTAFDNIDLSAAWGIDVVRSNASSLWGNAAGGVVSISSMPTAVGPFAMAQVVTGSHGLRRWVAQSSQPIGNGMAWATVTHSLADGWRANSDSRRTVLNTGVLARLGERTTAAVFATGANNLFHIPGPLTAAEANANPSAANATYASRDERRYNRLGRLGVTFEHAPSAGVTISSMLFVNPKFLQRSERATFRDFTRYHVGGNVSLRTRGVLSPTVRHELTVGADEAYQDGAILFYSLSPQNTRGTVLRDNKREGANNFGAFLQEEITLRERVSLLLGLRRDAISYFSQSFITPRLDDERTFARLTPKLGVLYRLTRRHSIYANVGGGVEAPAGNETDPASTFGQDTVTALNPLLEPIQSTTFEAGAKGLIASGSGIFSALSYDAATYLTRVVNEIVPYRGGRFYFTAGRARRVGAELGLNGATRFGMRARSALTLSNNEYVEYVVDSVHYGRPGASADYSGNEMVGVPRVMLSGALSYTPPPAPWLTMEVSANRTGRYFADDANTVVVPAYGTTSLSLAVSQTVGSSAIGVRGFLAVDNLFDRRYIGSAFLNPDVVGGQPVAFEPGQPRTVTIGLTLSRGR